MRAHLTDLPVVWGEMEINHGQWPAGTDATPLLKGLEGDLCPCPHWGYVLKGAIVFQYADGSQDICGQGDLFYTPAGHTAWVDEDTEFLLFSPAEEHQRVVAHMVGRREELDGQNNEAQ